MWITGWLVKVLTLALFPERCIGCGSWAAILCKKCAGELNAFEIPICLVCERYSINGKTHVACQGKHIPSQLFTPFEYQGHVQKIILKSKQGSNSYKLLDVLLSQQSNQLVIQTIPKTVEWIVPVPMSKSKSSQRLINHSMYISEYISAATNIPILDALKKTGKKSQKNFKASGRSTNIKGRIILNSNMERFVKSSEILLVDDVATTGSTLIECTRVLKTAETKDVLCYTLAKDLKKWASSIPYTQNQKIYALNRKNPVK